MPMPRPLIVALAFALAFVLGHVAGACRPAAEAGTSAREATARTCAAAVMADDDVAGPTCRACRARGEVTP